MTSLHDIWQPSHRHSRPSRNLFSKLPSLQDYTQNKKHHHRSWHRRKLARQEAFQSALQNQSSDVAQRQNSNGQNDGRIKSEIGQNGAASGRITIDDEFDIVDEDISEISQEDQEREDELAIGNGVRPFDYGVEIGDTNSEQITDLSTPLEDQEKTEQEEYEKGEQELAEQQDPGFIAFEMEGCNVLIHSLPDGRLNLRQVYFYDTELQIFSEPEVIGEMPAVPLYYAPSEWKEHYTGDSLMEKDPWEKIWKVYLTAVANSDPENFRLDLEQVYCLDAQARTLKREVVKRMTTETNLQNLTLRIRPEGCTIEENSEMILPYDLVEDHLEEKEILRVREAEEASGWTQTEYLPVSQANSLSQEEEEGTNVPRDPIDALNDDDREYDETFEDTPEVDQGY